MNAEQRIESSLKGEKVDRIAVMPKIWVDFSARVTNTTITDVIENPVVAMEVIAAAADKFGFDAARQFPFPARKIEKEGSVLYEVDANGRKLGTIDEQGGLATNLFDSDDYQIEDPVTMAYFQNHHPPKPVINSIEDAERIAVPDAEVFDQLGWYDNQKKVKDKYPDICLVGDCNSATMSFYVALRGVENAMFDLIDNAALVHAVMEKGAQIAIARGKYWLDKGFNVLRLNDSTGNLSLISADHWRTFVFPYIKQVCDELHSYNKDALIYCHICGNVLGIANQLVETGLDCIGPLDPLGGFTVGEFREKVGDRVSLMGGVNTLSLLNNTAEEVKEECLRCIEDAGDQGGYILSSGCVVPRDSREENVHAMVEAARSSSI